jgi:quinol monooxygenase YgiN
VPVDDQHPPGQGAQQFLFYAVHYPQPDKVDLLAQRMRDFGDVIKTQPGIIVVDTFRDPTNGTLLALALWESQEAFQAAWPALAQHAPSDEWETKPREVHTLLSAL